MQPLHTKGSLKTHLAQCYMYISE